MNLYKLWGTHKGKRADAVITRVGDKEPCKCMYQEISLHTDIISAIIARKQWLQENKIE